MSADRLTIFDTTLRDGEQAPGFSMRIDEKLKLARQLATLGVDIIEAGFPIASEADAESVRVISAQIRGPVIAALARCSPAGYRSRRRGARDRPAPPHSRLHRHVRSAPRAQASDDARGLPRRGGRRDPSRATLYRRRAVFGGRRDAKRHGFPVPGDSGSHFGRLHDGQSA